MSERLAALRRILAVQQIVRQRAEFALGAAERRKAAVEADRGDLAAFAESAALRGELARVADTQGRRLAQREREAASEILRQAKANQTAQARHKLTDEVLQRVAQDERASTERRELQDLIDELAGRPTPPV